MVLLAPVLTPGETPPPTYAFSATQPGDPGEPVRWDPCTEISYRVNPEQGPDGGVDLVTEAVAHVAELTGLRFRYDGTTKVRPDNEAGSAGAHVLIAWADEDEYEALDGRAVGATRRSAPARSDGRRFYFNAQVVLDTDLLDDGHATIRSVLLHELGHLVGLGHVDSPAELMYPNVHGLTDFAEGDRQGLAALGQGDCAPPWGDTPAETQAAALGA